MEIVKIQSIEDFERHESVNLIEEFKMLLARDWRVSVMWKCREENACAYLLAKRAMHLGPELCLLNREEAMVILVQLGIT